MNASIDPVIELRTMILLYIKKNNDGESKESLNGILAKKMRSIRHTQQKNFWKI